MAYSRQHPAFGDQWNGQAVDSSLPWATGCTAEMLCVDGERWIFSTFQYPQLWWVAALFWKWMPPSFPGGCTCLPPRMAGWVTDGGLGRIAAPLEQNQIGRGQNWLKCFSAICQWRGETNWATSASLLQFSHCPSPTPETLSLLPASPLSHCTTPFSATPILQLQLNGQHWCFQNTSFNFSSSITSCSCEIWVGFRVLAVNTGSGQSMGAAAQTHCTDSDISVPQRDINGSVRVPGYITIIHVTGCFCYLNVYSKNMRRRITFYAKKKQ